MISKVIKRSKYYLRQKIKRYEKLDRLLRSYYIFLTGYVYWLLAYCLPVNNKKIIFQSFGGVKVADSPKAIFESLYNNKGSEFHYVWILTREAQIRNKEYFSKFDNVSFVCPDTLSFYFEHAISKFWVVNCRLPLKLYKKNLQVLIQTWHGTPFKKIGCDLLTSDNSYISLHSVHEAYITEGKRCDYFLSSNSFSSSCFTTAFKLDASKIVNVGYPRNDALIINNNREYISSIKVKLGVPVDKKIVLYAPTFRDNNFSLNSCSYVADNLLDSEEFSSIINDDIFFIYRGHYFTRKIDGSDLFLDLSDYDDINDLYLVADILITDYSSVFFDYSILRRKIVFYMYDYERYMNKTRGFYDLDGFPLPGRVCRTIYQVAEELSKPLSTEERSILAEFSNNFAPLDDGSSSCRVINETILK